MKSTQKKNQMNTKQIIFLLIDLLSLSHQKKPVNSLIFQFLQTQFQFNLFNYTNLIYNNQSISSKKMSPFKFEEDFDPQQIQGNHHIDVIKGRWQKIKLADTFKQTKKLDCYSLTLGLNQEPNIINQIAFPIYVNLNCLQLAKNNISNIQSISFINAPNLQVIGLSVNHITSLQAFSKCSFPYLHDITLQFNKFKSSQPLQQLTRCSFGNKTQRFQQLSLQAKSKSHIGSMIGMMSAPQNIDQSYMKQLNDLTSLVKLNTGFIKTISVLKKYRITQTKLMNSLKRKYQEQRIAESSGQKFTASVYISLQG